MAKKNNYMAKVTTPVEQEDDEMTGGAEVASNWYKFNEVGKGIKGTKIGQELQKATEPGFQDQMVYKLKKANGQVWNVPVSVSKVGTVTRLDGLKNGTIVGVMLEKIIPATSKLRKDTKALKVLTFGVDSAYSEMDGGEEVESDEPVM
jgi:hypothetical protein